MKNIIALPPYYSGTSFEDIVSGLKIAIPKSGLNIEFLGYTKPYANTIKGGALDDSRYVAGQIKLLKDLIALKYPRRILFLDFFNPGLDLLKYAQTQREKACVFGSLLHGGSFLSGDLYSWPWLSEVELGWAGIYETVYAPSRFFAAACPKPLKKKTSVFPWGMDAYQNIAVTKKKRYDVVFPHRIDADKGIEDLLIIIARLPKLQFVITTSQSLKTLRQNRNYKALKRMPNVMFVTEQSQKQHLRTLALSRIVLSCAKQENFGYAIMKAVACGCIPVLPNRLCYPEFFPKMFLYENNMQAVQLIQRLLTADAREDVSRVAKRIKNFSFVPLLQDFFG